jgi:hypothetical protein
MKQASKTMAMSCHGMSVRTVLGKRATTTRQDSDNDKTKRDKTDSDNENDKVLWEITTRVNTYNSILKDNRDKGGYQ